MKRRTTAKSVPSGTSQRRIVLLSLPCAEGIDVIGALDVFLVANQIVKTMTGRGPAYATELVSVRPGIVSAWSGMRLLVDRAYTAVDGPIDTLIVGPSTEHDLARHEPALVSWLRRTARRSRRVASLCSGAFLLAAAGVLDGRRATTHWTDCADLAHRYPRVIVEPEPIYVCDRGVYTSAGGTSSMDLVLGLIEEDLGPRVAHAVAQELVLFLKRPGGQPQLSVQLSTQLAERQPLRELQAWIADHLAEDLSIPSLARRVAMSSRNFFRVFTREVGITPARFVERARVESARRLLEDTAHGVDDIAARCGFGAAETMRAAFLRILRISPQAYRARLAASGDGHRLSRTFSSVRSRTP